MSQKLPVGGFKSVENTSQFDKGLIKNCNEDNDEIYILEVDVEYPEKLHELYNYLPLFTRKNENWKNWKTCSQLA